MTTERILPALLVLLAAATGCRTLRRPPADFVVATRGAECSCTIVCESSAPAVYTAAEELRVNVWKTTGVDLPIGGDAPRRIVLAERGVRTGAEQDAFEIRLDDDGTLRVTGGGPRGCLYGVYELLERFGGIRFYTSWCEKIPDLDRFAVPAGTRIAETPDFEMRQPLWYDVSAHPEFAARLRVNASAYAPGGDAPERFGGASYRFGGGLKSCHTFNLLCSPDVYFDTHPEYFSLVDGKRKKERTQLCLTNPDVLEIVTSNVLARIRSDPGAKFYGVSQNDWYDYCECDACRAVDEEEGSHAGTMVRFVNAVAERVEREFPDVLIETLAYQYTRTPPKKTRLRHNVVPCLCTIELDFARPIPDSPYPQNQAFRDDIVGWSGQTDRLYVWDYVTQFPHYPHAFANVGALQGNIRFFRDNGVKMLFEQGAREGHHAGFAELKAWLLAKWMWNADLDRGKLLDDFFSGYYGAGAPFVRIYFDELHRRQELVSRDPAHPLRIFDGVTGAPYDDAGFMAMAEDLWNRAEEAVKDDPVRAYNVRMGHFSHRYTLLEQKRAGASDAALRNDPEAVALARKLLADKASAIGPMQVREWSETERLDGWREIAKGLSVP